jgi:hypothetical protein
MSHTVKAVAAALLTLGLAFAAIPLGGGGASINVGSIGCCRQ